MKKGYFWLGMSVTILVFGITVVGCDLLFEDEETLFSNQSSYTVTFSSSDYEPSYFTIYPGQTKSATTTKALSSFSYEPKNLVTVDLPTGGSKTWIFRNK